MKSIIVLFGKPGVGKGTLLSKFLEGRGERFEVLSVGNLLRKARKEQTELGKKAEIYMDSGKLVPNEIINEIVIEGIKKAKNSVVIDGFPRTVAQAEAMFEAGIYPDKVINVIVDDYIIIQRAKDRVVCENCGEPYTTNDFKRPNVEGICDKCGGKLSRRKDDDENVVKKRLEVYENETAPVLTTLSNKHAKIYIVDNTLKNASEKFAQAFNS